MQYKTVVNSARLLDHEFTAYDEMLERVEVFKYLGRLLAFDDNNIHDIEVLSSDKHVVACYSLSKDTSITMSWQ